MRRPRQSVLICFTGLLLAVSFVKPLFPHEQPLHHLPTVLVLGLLWHLSRREGISDASVVCICGFLWLHILGARYVYSCVPYDHWAATLSGVTLSSTFGWTRNHYDRLVHFAFGCLAITPSDELLRRAGGLRRALRGVLCLSLVVAASAGYEIVEWLLAVFMDPDGADRYNGQQGDFWDAQKDMGLALIGAVLAMITIGVLRRSTGPPEKGEPA